MTPLELASSFDATMRELWKGDIHKQWPADAVSDHLPRVYRSKQGVSVVTWNVLNQKWMHHIVNDKAESRATSRHFSLYEADARERLGLVLREIGEMCTRGHIVCLQEVGDELLAALNQTLEITAKGDGPWALLTTRVHNGNCNVVIYYKRAYDLVMRRVLLSADPAAKRYTPTDYFVMRRLSTTLGENELRFNLANVHLNWKEGAQFVKDCIEVLVGGSAFPTIVCGDLNASARMPPNVEGDHITMYDAIPGVMFAAPEPPLFLSHVTWLSNAVTADRQCELYDHVFVINAGPDF